MGYTPFWVGQDRPLQKIIYHSLLVIHCSLNVYACRVSPPSATRATKKLPEKNINYSLLIIHYSLKNQKYYKFN